MTIPGYPNLRWSGGAAAKPAEQQVSPDVLQRLQWVAGQLGGVMIDIFSGSGGPAVRGAGFAGDPHERKIAADASIKGKPIGSYPGAVPLLHQAGLRSGAVDFTYQGRPDPAHVDTVTIPRQQKAGSSTASPESPPPSPAFQEILRRSVMDNLDPAAVAAVASVEGGFTKRPGTYDPDQQGNPGWAYGPFQMRSPGALPIESAGANGPGNAYAWSNVGIDYAVDQIAKVAGGRKGQDAITAIVRDFEKPANPDAEIARAQKAYDFYAKGGSGGDPYPGFRPDGPGATNPGGLIGGTASAIDGISHALGVIFSARGLEMGAGFVLIVLGVLWLARRGATPAAALAAATS